MRPSLALKLQRFALGRIKVRSLAGFDPDPLTGEAIAGIWSEVLGLLGHAPRSYRDFAAETAKQWQS